MNINERFLGFWDCPHADSESLYNLFKKIASDLKLDLGQLVGQCYDGAASMSGIHKGLSTRVKADYPMATYVHCYAHRLNLVLQDSCQSIKEIRNTIGTLNCLYAFVERSAKRHALFHGLQAENARALKQLSETRWASRFTAFKAVKETLPFILQFLMVS